MDDRLAEHSAGRGEQPKQYDGRDAMHGAQARQAHRKPVEPRIEGETPRHPRLSIVIDDESYNIS